MLNFFVTGLFLLVATAVICLIVRKELVETFREIQIIAPRCVYAIRAARSAWLAWDDPIIAEHRKALEGRATADRHALERALIEAAHQQEAGR